MVINFMLYFRRYLAEIKLREKRQENARNKGLSNKREDWREGGKEIAMDTGRMSQLTISTCSGSIS